MDYKDNVVAVVESVAAGYGDQVIYWDGVPAAVVVNWDDYQAMVKKLNESEEN